MRVGELEILPVHDGVARIPISDPFLGMPRRGVGAAPAVPHRRRRARAGARRLPACASGDRVGAHRLRRRPHRRGRPSRAVRCSPAWPRYGVQPDDVTDVLFTHLHFDHVGWATQQGRVVFPNATYRCDERDWAHFVGPDEGATRKLVAAHRPHGVLVAAAARCCPAST